MLENIKRLLRLPTKPIILDKIFIINLERSHNRWEKIKNQLNNYKMEYERFPATDGLNIKIVDDKDEEFGADEILSAQKRLMFGHKYRILADGNQLTYITDPEIMKRVLTIGEIGCYLSHFRIYKTMVEQNLKYALIMEDDSIIKPNFQGKLDQILKHTPKNWDIIFLYTTFSKNRLIYKNILNPYLKEISYKSNGLAGLCAYMVSELGAKKLLKYTKIITTPIDDIIRILVSRNIINTYISNEYLVDSPYGQTIEDSIISQMGRTNF